MKFKISPLRTVIASFLAAGLFGLSLFAALESSHVVQRTDSSQEGTVGIISIRGWPLTFESTAPGYALAQDTSQPNFEVDALFYFVIGSILVGVLILLARRFVGRHGPVA